MYFGADYYPEHWPPERWATDARLMKEGNLNVVRVAEFAWVELEPVEGQYDFSWLDESIDTLAKEGIKVIMGTPTATPPKWLVDRHPGILMQDRKGQVRGFGSRRHYCYNDPTYREYTKRIVGEMARHYADNPQIIAWQIDNEFGCQDTGQCYCEDCLTAFKQWLKAKYGSLKALNETWGTVFWSQTYTDWDEIILPTYTVCEDSDPNLHGHSPGLLLDAFDYNKLLLEYYKAIVNNGYTTDATGIDSSLAKYKLVIMPAFNLMKDDIRQRLENYVAQGGTLILSFRSGTKEWSNAMTEETLPGLFRNLVGVEVEEFDSLNHGRTVPVTGAFGHGTASIWCDILKPQGAQVLARYSGDFYCGEAAVTVNSFGKGKVYYIGCDLDRTSMKVLMQHVAGSAGIVPPISPIVPGVEVVKKEKDDEKPYLMVLNHNATPAVLTLDDSYTDLISGKKTKEVLSLEPYAVAMLVK
ncbi:MAG: cellulase family glycosylhydrolase [Firmicutes bacterium]|nr:cellulase family glycosylhydrolase [Bacillota bacterium]